MAAGKDTQRAAVAVDTDSRDLAAGPGPDPAERSASHTSGKSDSPESTAIRSSDKTTLVHLHTWTDDNALKVEYTATTDKDTVVNLTQHSYFNLAGKDTILNHVVMIPADKFTPVDGTLIPTGELRPIDGTPFDFRTPTAIGARINQDDEQLKFGKGYDHNWVINKPLGQYGLMARVTEPVTGRMLEVFSTEPGLQFYSGNFLDGTLKGKGGWVYQFRDGFCMEPQHYPDSPNKPEFPSVVLKPGQTYSNTIVYKFSVKQ